MKITESRLRRLIQDMLREDYTGFVSRAKEIEDYYQNDEDPTFEHEDDVPSKQSAKQLKRAWGEEADHTFFQSLRKVHWFGKTNAYRPDDTASKVEHFLGLSRKNEISTMLYLPENFLGSFGWGQLGILIEGRTTLAHNDMNDLFSGFSGDLDDDTRLKYQHSGVPKRATRLDDWSRQGYILDRESFIDDSKSPQDGNEGIIDNWKPVGLVLSVNFIMRLKSHMGLFDFGLPLFDQNMNKIEAP